VALHDRPPVTRQLHYNHHLQVLRVTVKTSRVASRSFRPRLKGIELAADGGSYRRPGSAC